MKGGTFASLARCMRVGSSPRIRGVMRFGSLAVVARGLVTLFIIMLAVCGAFAQQPAAPKRQNPFEGAWAGTLSVQGEKLVLVFHISANPDGSASATFDSPDQGAEGLSFDSAVIDEKRNTIRLDAKDIQASFFGSLESDGSIIGHWAQGELTLPLTLKRAENLPGLNRPQEPKPPFPYLTEEVAYENPRAKVTLAGTLSIPKGEGPFPAILLVAGSGPMDRDEAIFSHKPFLVLADDLTKQGIVVLRADKRGIGKSTGDYSKALDSDFADDALAGVEFLKSRKEVNPRAIGIIGHSEGGLVAPRVAASSKEVAFIVLLAAPGLPGDQIILSQWKLINRTSGVDEARMKEGFAMEEKIIAVAKQEADVETARSKIREIFKASLPKDAPQALVERQVKKAASPWLHDFLNYDPAPALSKVKCPVLAIAGSKDLQVPPVENLFAIRSALQSGENKAVTIKILPGLNHLFQTAATGLPAEYGKIEETFSPSALKVIGDWIAEVTPKSK